jgi:hypothetical protein
VQLLAWHACCDPLLLAARPTDITLFVYGPNPCWSSQILETKVRKLEQLVKLKDAKIQTLVAKLQAAGLA